MFSKKGFFENEMGEGDGMKYMTLTKIYYAMPALYEEIYEARYHAPFTFQFGISIRQYHRKNAYPAFFITRGNMLLRQKKSIRLMSAFYTW